MNDARMDHTAVLLDDGRVLIAGGSVGYHGNAISSAELYNSRQNVFTRTGSMSERRAEHTATKLQDGRVLIAGGTTEGDELHGALSGGALSSAELYDPETGAFVSTDSMIDARYGHIAVLLKDGRVLVAGGRGRSGASLRSVELFDPRKGDFVPAGDR